MQLPLRPVEIAAALAEACSSTRRASYILSHLGRCDVLGDSAGVDALLHVDVASLAPILGPAITDDPVGLASVGVEANCLHAVIELLAAEEISSFWGLVLISF